MPPLLIIIASGMAAYIAVKWFENVQINKYEPSPLKAANKVKRLSNEMPNQAAWDFNVPENTVNQAAEQDFSIASWSLAFAIAGIFYPSLRLASVLGVAYNTTPIWQLGYKSLFKEKEFNAIVIDSIAVAGLLITQHYFLAALLNWLFYSSKKLLLDLKGTFKKNLIHFFATKDLPNIVWLLKEGVEIEVPLNTLKVGDIVVVNSGGIIPVDGTIIYGIASIDQNIVTGEEQPSEKQPGDQVLAFTVVLSGIIHIQVEKWGKETFAAKMASNFGFHQEADSF